MARKGNRQIKIEKKYLVLCEGVDALYFLIHYLNSEQLKGDPRFADDIQVMDFGGINDLPRFLLTLQGMERFDEVESIAIIRDAETDAKAAVSSIKSALQSAGLPVPPALNQWQKESDKPQTAFTLFPTCDQNPKTGALEDFCWDLLRDRRDDLKTEVDEFVARIKTTYGTVTSHQHKSRLHAFFSVNQNLVSLKIGEAAGAGAFDWGKSELLPLKNMLQEGFASSCSLSKPVSP